MNKVYFIFFLFITGQVMAQKFEPVNKDASPEAKKLLSFYQKDNYAGRKY